MKRYICFCVFVKATLFATFILTCSVSAQLKPKERAQFQYTKWHTRVDDQTKEIANDVSSLLDGEQSLYLALLAKIWWKNDETRARVHLKKAAEKLLGAVKANDKTDLEKELKFSKRTLEILIGLDEKLGQNLVGQIEAAVGGSDDTKKKDSQEMAELFASVGRQVVNSNPRLAFACGMDSLSYGFASEFPTLVVELNKKDSSLAELLIKRSLVLANGRHTYASDLLIFNLSRYMAESNGGTAFADALHRSVLQVFADTLADASSVEQERPNRCGIAFFAPSVLPRIEIYLPALSLTFRQNLQTCIPYTRATLQEMTKAAANDDYPKTVDDLLRAARETRDLELRVRFYRRALSQLENEKKFDEMISILDGIDGDDYRKLSPIGWDNWRVGAAFDAVIVAVDVDDLPAAYRIIERTPKVIRSDLRLRIARKLTPSSDNPFYVDNLDGMQKEVGTIEQADKDAARFYRILAELYIKIRPTESEAMFRNAVKFINKADNDNPDFANDKDWAPWMDYVPMSAELLDFDEQSISSSLNSISSRRSRVRIKLGLLESCLKKYVDAKKTLDTLNKSKK